AGAAKTAATRAAPSAGPLPGGSDDRTPPSVSTPATAAGRSGSCTGSTVDGPTVDTRWGPVQVAVTVAADGKLCDVEPLQYPNDNRRSAAINRQALPVLHDRAVRQGASFDAVSGATVTSEGYRASLQAVLDH
ncbi:MAG TPA: FMN-binding protein, partial [Candidatus Dormibacteraeota bacterium]|nr:FMN-binding protein [Candidatus Dormibacteraeota bacterium]